MNSKGMSTARRFSNCLQTRTSEMQSGNQSGEGLCCFYCTCRADASSLQCLWSHLGKAWKWKAQCSLSLTQQWRVQPNPAVTEPLVWRGLGVLKPVPKHLRYIECRSPQFTSALGCEHQSRSRLHQTGQLTNAVSPQSWFTGLNDLVDL